MALKSKPYEISGYNLHSALQTSPNKEIWHKKMVAISSRTANQAKSKMAANSLENWKKAMIWWLIDIEWWFWCPNTGLLTQGLTQRQQNNCMSNIRWPNPRWPPFCQKKAKIAMKYELIDLEWRFWSPYVGLLSQGLTSIQKKNVCQILSGRI